nr:hypothetical protein [Tanacetum cinerariifolium]
EEVVYTTLLSMVYEVFCIREKNCCSKEQVFSSYIKVLESAQDKDVGLGEVDSETLPKRSLRRKLFKTCCMNLKEVNPTHAYYNGSCTSKDTEDPSWSTSFKTRRTQKTSLALEDFVLLYLCLIGTL